MVKQKLIPTRRFYKYLGCSIAVDLVATIGGVLLRTLRPSFLAMVGFWIFVGYLWSMLPIEFIHGYVSGDREPRKRGQGPLARLIEITRTTPWTARQIYSSLTAQVGLAALGLALAVEPGRTPLTALLCCCLSVWRFALIRRMGEPYGTPHALHRGEHSSLDLILNLVADVPSICIAFVLALATTQTVWLLAAAMIASYSFLVRAGQYQDDAGPGVYALTVTSLLVSAVLVWPLAQRFSPIVNGIPSWLAPAAGVALASANFFEIIDIEVPLRRRVLPGTFFLIWVSLGFWIIILHRPLHFDRVALFGPFAFRAQSIPAVVAAFLLPMLLYFVATQVGLRRKWIWRDRRVERGLLGGILSRKEGR